MSHGGVKGDSLAGVLHEQLLNQVFGVAAHRIPARQVENQFIIQSHPNCLLLRLVVEWQGTRKESIDDAAQGPHITTESIGLLLEDLRGNIA